MSVSQSDMRIKIDTLKLVARLLVKLQEDELALSIYNRILCLGSIDPEVCLEKGDILLRLNHATEALNAYDQVSGLEHNPSIRAFAFYGKGRAHFSLKEYEQAKDAFEQVVNLDPNFVKAYYALGLTLYQLLQSRLGTPEFYALAIEFITTLEKVTALKASSFGENSTRDILPLLNLYKQRLIACNNATTPMNVVTPIYNSLMTSGVPMTNTIPQNSIDVHSSSFVRNSSSSSSTTASNPLLLFANTVLNHNASQATHFSNNSDSSSSSSDDQKDGSRKKRKFS